MLKRIIYQDSGLYKIEVITAMCVLVMALCGQLIVSFAWHLRKG
jgi:hypothetical protein